MDQNKIINTFNKFAGKEVDVQTTIHQHRRYGTIEKHDLDYNQKIIQEMQQAAQDMGIALRIWMPNTMGTMDYRTDRLNVHIDKDDNGKWRVKKNMNFG